MSQKSKINIQIWLLALASSILLSIPYIVPHCGLVSLVAFIPLFAAEQIAYNNGKKHFFHIAYTSFLVWNLIATYWVWFATPPGAVAAFLLNTLQMAILFTLFRWMRKFTNGFLPYIFFIVIWLAWEHSYQTWQVTWPWLVLGNSFATSIKHIQWYEFTGSLGGTLWILLTNLLLYRIILLKLRHKPIKISVASLAVIVLFPTILSHIMYYNYREAENPAQFAVLQPNIDPYTDKFGGMTQMQQTSALLELAGKASAQNSAGEEQIVVAPETFIFTETWNTRLREEAPQYNPAYRAISQWVAGERMAQKQEPFIVGAVSYDGKRYFNTAVFMEPQGDSAVVVSPEYYHKSKLVILAESNPFKSGPFKFMDKLVRGMAGGIGDFGTQEERTLFETQGGARIGTAICYESVFGDFYREWANNGANVMTIITNDGWWRDTPGHKQHLNYARLRAIENRRSIARSANTGISAFINQRGDIVQRTAWWEMGYLTGTLNLNEEKTIFTTHGDIIGRLSRFLAFLFLLMGVARKIAKKHILRCLFV
ncbi:MAG: apolipoprotein N-acyltransferase [Bacteroidales bacterium]|nr:apolipoprotein N-acyltransferase [Bacteroidales bacterium]